MKNAGIKVYMIISIAVILFVTSAAQCMIASPPYSMQIVAFGGETINRTSSSYQNTCEVSAETAGLSVHTWNAARRVSVALPVILVVTITAVYVALIHYMKYCLHCQNYFIPKVLVLSKYIKKSDGRKRVGCNSL